MKLDQFVNFVLSSQLNIMTNVCQGSILCILYKIKKNKKNIKLDHLDLSMHTHCTKVFRHNLMTSPFEKIKVNNIDNF